MQVTDFEEAAEDMLKRPAQGCVATRRWKAFFGVTPAVCLIVWCKLDPLNTMPTNTKPYHLLWALFFLMVHPTEEIATAICGCDEKTYRKWVKLFVVAISFLEHEVIVWNNRFMGDKGNDALVTIDGTDMKVQMHYDKRYFSHKFHSKGLRYEVGVCILTGCVVWINGPFRCGIPDIEIARQCLIGNLTLNEMVEADNGYEGEDWHVRTPNSHYRTNNEKKMKRRAAQRHETVNERLKNFNVLGNAFRLPLERHSSCFRAVAVLTQLNIENGERLFEVEYIDDV